MKRSFAIAFAFIVAGAVAPADAAHPSAEKVTDELARISRAARRADPLLLEVTLSIGDSEPLAKGVLASHPTGLARLELESPQGFVERHLLQGSEYNASRDGRPLRSPRPFLPPFFLIQAASGATLRAALASFGVAPGEISLGLADDHDCYVLGERAPPGAQAARAPSVWIDMQSLQIVRVDRQDGVRYRFGPPAVFAGIEVPSWIVIEAPDQAPARLAVERAAPASAPAAAFGADWLTAPQSP